MLLVLLALLSWGDYVGGEGDFCSVTIDSQLMHSVFRGHIYQEPCRLLRKNVIVSKLCGGRTDFISEVMSEQPNGPELISVTSQRSRV